jgi:hypothetical protein
MREIRKSGSAGGGNEINRFSLPRCASASVFGQGGASPFQASANRPVTDGNCVAARRGGEQPKVNDQSVTIVNSIRPYFAASLLA